MIAVIIIAGSLITAAACLTMEGPKSALGSLVTGALMFGLCTLSFVSTGHVGVEVRFGAVQNKVLSEGVSLINPFHSVKQISIQRGAIDYTGDTTVTVLANDQIEMGIDLTVPYRIMPDHMPQYIQKYPTISGLLTPISRSALRDCAAAQSWSNMTKPEGRETLSTCTREKISDRLVADLTNNGFTDNEAMSVFEIFPLQIRAVRPINENLIQAVADKKASDERLAKQESLANIERKIAERRADEGAGIANLVNSLPKDVSVTDIAALLRAQAEKEKAEAIHKAIEQGDPHVTFIVGTGAMPAITTK